jgi:hypothetical protein
MFYENDKSCQMHYKNMQGTKSSNFPHMPSLFHPRRIITFLHIPYSRSQGMPLLQLSWIPSAFPDPKQCQGVKTKGKTKGTSRGGPFSFHSHSNHQRNQP